MNCACACVDGEVRIKVGKEILFIMSSLHAIPHAFAEAWTEDLGQLRRAPDVECRP